MSDQTNILLPWEQFGPMYMRTLSTDKNKQYGWVIQEARMYADVFYYHAYDILGEAIFKLLGSANSDFANSLAEAQKLVDDALIEAGWRLLNPGDKLLLLI